MAEEKRNIPKLRFKGFTDDWIQDKLENRVVKLKSYPLSRKYESPNNTGFKYIHYGDIHTGLVSIINDTENLLNISKGNYDSLDEGDIVLADASEDFKGIAWPALLNTKSNNQIIAGLHTIPLRPLNINSLFMYYTFLTTSFRKYGYRMGTGMKVFGITYNNLVKYTFNYPSISEQKKIARLIYLVEKIITLERKREKYIKQLQTALYQDFFNYREKKSSLYFNDPQFNWEYKQFNEIIDSSFKGKIKASDIYPGDIEYLDTNRLNGGEPIYSDAEKNVDKENILILWDGSKAGKIYSGFEGVLGSTIKSYTLNNNINSQYIYHYLKSKEKVISERYTTPNIPHVIKDFDKVFKISLPDYFEQNKISKLLSAIDIIIEKHNKKIKKYKKIKSILLSEIFV